KVGQTGKAYVIDAQGRLIAHPDISLVLRNIDLSHIVERHSSHSIQLPEPADGGEVIQDMQGRSALAGFAPVGHVGWLVCVELPVAEAYAPLVESIARSLAILVVALGLAMFAGLILARKMVVPIQALSMGAARIGAGDLGQRISINSGDELEALGDQFNSMA